MLVDMIRRRIRIWTCFDEVEIHRLVRDMWNRAKIHAQNGVTMLSPPSMPKDIEMLTQCNRSVLSGYGQYFV